MEDQICAWRLIKVHFEFEDYRKEIWSEGVVARGDAAELSRTQVKPVVVPGTNPYDFMRVRL